jgi:hypothetical protein
LRPFADYFQVRVFDEGTETDLGNLWASQEVRNELAVGLTQWRAVLRNTVCSSSVTPRSVLRLTTTTATPSAGWRQQHHLVQLRRL